MSGLISGLSQEIFYAYSHSSQNSYILSCSVKALSAELRESSLPFHWLRHSAGKCRFELPQAEEATERRSVTSWMHALGYHMKGGQQWHFQTCFKGGRREENPVFHTEKDCQPKRIFYPVNRHLKSPVHFGWWRRCLSYLYCFLLTDLYVFLLTMLTSGNLVS